MYSSMFTHVYMNTHLSIYMSYSYGRWHTLFVCVFPYFSECCLPWSQEKKEVNKIAIHVFHHQSAISLEPSVPCLFSSQYFRVQIM